MKKNIIFNISYAGFFESEVFSMFSSSDYHVFGAWDSTIARDIVFSKATNKTPLIPFLDYDKRLICFSSLFGSELKFGTEFEAYLNFDFLSHKYPEAIFILFDPDNDIWRSKFFNPVNAEYIHTAENLYSRSGEGLIDFLIAQKDSFINKVKLFFGDSKRLVTISNFNDEIQFHKHYFGEIFNIEICDDKVHEVENDKKNISTISCSSKITSSDIDVLNNMVEFCSAEFKHTEKNFSACSDISACYTSSTGYLSTLDGMPHEHVVKTLDGKFISNPDYENVDWKFQRVAAVLNNVSRYISDDFSLRLDMQDNRLLGASDEMDIGNVVFGYCRRQGAKNIALLPLPGFHDIGGNGFVGGLPKDDIHFEEKINKVVWRGALSGFCNGIGHDNIVDDYKNPTHVVLNDLILSLSHNDYSNVEYLVNNLNKNVRYNFVAKNIGNSNVDAAFILEDDFRERLSKFDAISSLESQRKPPQWIWEHKYIACLRGFDTASNFIMALASNSVAMKEEDGWEVYYSFLFKPWVHYIPLAPGAADIDEKYDWAENNPDACKEMILNSNKVVNYLSRYDLRSWYLRNLINNH